MIHKSLPQTKTAEALAVWIRDQHKEVLTHTEKFPLTEDEIRELEHSSAQASAALYRLKEVEDLFKEIIKGGTMVIHNETTGEPEMQPATVNIPPTKGTKSLEANRKFADDQLKEGFRYEYTNIYLIPWPEESKMVGVDIEGKEWPEYTRFMTNFELNANKPLLKTTDKDWGKEEVKEYLEKEKVVVYKNKPGNQQKIEMEDSSELDSDLGPADELPFI